MSDSARITHPLPVHILADESANDSDVPVAGDDEDVLVAGCPLPALEKIQWESKSDRPGWYAWHAPFGTDAPRKTKTYLGYANKGKLAEWLKLPINERRPVVMEWVADRRAEKGIR